MRIALVIVAVLSLALLGVGLYSQQRLAPLMEAKGMEVVPRPLTLPPPGPVHPIDLGFVSFAIPTGIKGEPVQHDDTLFFSVQESPTAASRLTLCPLVPEDAPESKQLVQQYEDLSGERIESYWELRKRALHAQPFSVWSVPFRGFRRSVIDATLLVIKGLDSRGVDQIGIHEDANLGLTITRRNEMTFIQLHDKRARAGQLFLVPNGTINPEEVAAALVSTYRIATTDFSIDSLRAQLRAAGIRQVTRPPPETVAPTFLTGEEERLRLITEEVRARREQREAGRK